MRDTLGNFITTTLDRTSYRPEGKQVLTSVLFTNEELKSVLYVDPNTDSGLLAYTSKLAYFEGECSTFAELCTLRQLCIFLDSSRIADIPDGDIANRFIRSYNRLGNAILFANCVR